MYPGLTTTTVDQGFSNSNALNQLGVLLKCKFCISESGVELKAESISHKFSSVAPAGPWTHFEWQGPILLLANYTAGSWQMLLLF